MKENETINKNVTQHLPINRERNKETVTASFKGSIILEKEYGTLKFQRPLSHPIEKVWNAISNPAEVSEWMSNYKGVINGYNGGTIDFINTASGSQVSGNIIVWKPYHVFEYEWHIAPNTILPEGEPESIIRWELKQDDNSNKNTFLFLTHSRLTKPTSLNFAPGWHAYLDRLEAHLNNEELPDWIRRLGEVKGMYSS
jgi:uncharacterized protein YndB with AHSA1/START domain